MNERTGAGGNQQGAPADLTYMGCSTCREHLSADLDGEADFAVLNRAYAHLETCHGCSRWFSEAARVNRLIRTTHAEPSPGLSGEQLEHALEHLPHPRRRHSSRRHGLGRWALGGIGAAQAVLGLLGLIVPNLDMGHAMHHGTMMGADLAHMSHESSAWNLALGVAFIAGAAWTRHLAGVLPVLGSFVLVLSLVSVLDLLGGNVDAARVASHSLVAIGFGLIVLIVTTGSERPGSRPRNALPSLTSRVAAHLTATDTGGPISGGHPGPAAHHRAA